MENKTKIQKPIIIVLNETEEKIVEVLNGSSLPAFIIKPMLEKILNQVNLLEQKEQDETIKTYNAQLLKAGEE